MQSIRECPVETLRQLGAVLCSINETLAWEGKHPTVAYQALKNLRGKDMTMRRQNRAPV